MMLKAVILQNHCEYLLFYASLSEYKVTRLLFVFIPFKESLCWCSMTTPRNKLQNVEKKVDRERKAKMSIIPGAEWEYIFLTRNPDIKSTCLLTVWCARVLLSDDDGPSSHSLFLLKSAHNIRKAAFTHTGLLQAPATAPTPAPACGFSHTPTLPEPSDSLFSSATEERCVLILIYAISSVWCT